MKSNGAESAATLLVPSVWKDCSVSTMPGLSWAPKPGFSSVGSSKVVQCRGFSRSTSTLKPLQLGHPKTASLRSRFGEERIQATSLLWVRHHQERSQQIARRERFRAGFPAGVSIWLFHGFSSHKSSLWSSEQFWKLKIPKIPKVDAELIKLFPIKSGGWDTRHSQTQLSPPFRRGRLPSSCTLGLKSTLTRLHLVTKDTEGLYHFVRDAGSICIPFVAQSHSHPNSLCLEN